MVEKTSADCLSTSSERGSAHRSFPDDIQTTFFDCRDSSSYTEDDILLGDLNPYIFPIFYSELDN